MEGRERFAKCFVIIVEKCKSWILTFVEKRIHQDHNGQTLEQFIKSSYALSTHNAVKRFLPISSSSNLDISPLWVIIQTGKLLKHGEEKTVGHYYKTTGDQVDRIHLIRNTFMHTPAANLAESEYEDYINDFKDIGKQFEGINCEKNGTYTKQIEEINDTSFDTSKVDRTVDRYEKYVQTVWQTEILTFVNEKPAPVKEKPEEKPAPPNCRCYRCRYGHTADCACKYCSHRRDDNNCQCYHCCHHYPNGCQCDDCQYKRSCIIL